MGAERVNIREFLAALRRERYRTFVVHSPPLTGKTTFARALAESTPGSAYFDVLAFVADRPDLANGVDILDAVALQKLVLDFVSESAAGLVLVDEFDFLIPVWGGDLLPFERQVETIAPPRIEAVIGYFLQSRPELQEWRLATSGRVSRILALDAIEPLPTPHRDDQVDVGSIQDRADLLRDDSE